MSEIKEAVVVVDDDPEIVSLLSKTLQPHFRVFGATSGVEALGLIGDEFGLRGGLWDVFAWLNDQLEFIGYAVIAIFIGSWLLSMLIYRLRGYDRLDVQPSHS
jgi:high-affinity nickel permease